MIFPSIVYLHNVVPCNDEYIVVQYRNAEKEQEH